MLRTSAFVTALILGSAMAATPATPAAPAPAPMAAEAAHHVMMTDRQIKWGPAPASLPKGAQAAVLYGDPAKEGLFVLRLKMPAGYNIPPHSHPGHEIVTVISGDFALGHDASNDPKKVAVLPAGSFFAFDPGMTHYAYAKTPVVVQISTIGPWGVDFVKSKAEAKKPGM